MILPPQTEKIKIFPAGGRRGEGAARVAYGQYNEWCQFDNVSWNINPGLPSGFGLQSNDLLHFDLPPHCSQLKKSQVYDLIECLNDTTLIWPWQNVTLHHANEVTLPYTTVHKRVNTMNDARMKA